MSRPHEDLQRHTDVDHRPGGPPIELPPAARFAIDIVYIKSGRLDAALSSYETLIEKARTSGAKAGTSAVLRSENDGRVIALVELEGHEAFGHLKSAWDNHHLTQEHRDVAESSSLGLYQLAAVVGEPALDPTSKDVYAFEHFARSLEVSWHQRSGDPAGFQGALSQVFKGFMVFKKDDDTQSAAIYRGVQAQNIDTFRASVEAQRVFGAVGGQGETFVYAHPVKTFA